MGSSHALAETFSITIIDLFMNAVLKPREQKVLVFCCQSVKRHLRGKNSINKCWIHIQFFLISWERGFASSLVTFVRSRGQNCKTKKTQCFFCVFFCFNPRCFKTKKTLFQNIVLKHSMFFLNPSPMSMPPRWDPGPVRLPRPPGWTRWARPPRGRGTRRGSGGAGTQSRFFAQSPPRRSSRGYEER